MHIKRFTWLILLLLIKCGAFTQDTVMVISPALFEGGAEAILPAKMNGWYFKQGNDTAWASKTLDMKGWKKMRPVDLSVDLADANGKVEGWFRGTIKIDSSFGETQLVLLLTGWAAQDLFIDGQKIASSGITGSNRLPYAENNSFKLDYISLSALKPGSRHTISWHIVDARALPFNSKKLKSDLNSGLQTLFFISTLHFINENKFSSQIIFGIILSLLVLMTLLWLLWILNKEEKNILHFSLFTTFLNLYLILGNINGNFFYSFPVSYATYYLLYLLAYIFLYLAIGYLPYLLALIFRHPLKKRIIYLSVILVFVNVIDFIFLSNQMLESVNLIVGVLISLYIILSSLKKAKGGDWAIIVGIFLTMVSWLLNNFYFKDFKIALYAAYGGFLIFPLSILVYVAIRFREMIKDIRANAEEVIKLSDEKRIQAEQQQEILEVQVRERTLELVHKNGELEIEAALEKVRSRSLAMHHSDELKEVISEVLRKLQELGIAMESRSAIICLYKEGEKEFEQWVASPEHDAAHGVHATYFDSVIHKDIWDARINGTDFYTKSYTVEEKNAMFHFFFDNTDLRSIPETEKNWLLEQPYYELASAFEKHSAVMIANFTADLLDAGTHQILKRFAKVFEQAYIRFLDLQKAEAQARESQIELSLERVRARAMAMQHSNELAELVDTVFKELTHLHFSMNRCQIMIIDPDGRSMRTWMANPEIDKTPNSYLLTLNDHPYFVALINAWKEKQPIWIYNLKGDEKVSMVNYVFTHTEFSNLPEMVKNGMIQTKSIFFNASFNNFGSMQVDTLEPLSKENLEILNRFGNVFDYTYKRFNDLQKAEAQARESQIEAALERVRSRSMAMRKSEELADLSFELVKQVHSLGVPTWFCAFNITNETENNSIEWGSNAEGTYDKYITPRENVFLRYYEAGKRGEVLHINEIGPEGCVKHYQYLCSLHGLGEQLVKMKDAGLSFPKSQIDHVAYFKYGYILFITFEPAVESHDIFIRFAKVFEQTYIRFLDLQRSEAQAEKAEEDLILLKAEKKRTEEALNELQITQKQLIQSEKMASLGELTAGIAHEIQNPLNFVNNFSEVSTELVDEMNEEIQNGNLEDAQHIAKDLKENLEKINHHGKRAGDIVKGMLQHSRSSNGQKEPTDINVLADEYLRLAYHGLRAKDKEFNATLVTDLDSSIGMMNIIPQDMGRVILNLITNAFYAVSEKKKIVGDGFEPTVTLTTKKLAEKVHISVIDNGNGIPQKVIEKIFQPFFTTKPTGQGTGLGLSLSYDIVKAHGGEITVSSKLNEGSEFIILIPNNN